MPIGIVELRPASAGDIGFLEDMLIEAAHWRDAGARPARHEILGSPGVGHYLDRWPGERGAGVVASVGHEDVGAAWWVYLSGDDPGYGWVDDETPEVVVAVVAAHRGRGAGTALLDGLHRAAAAAGVARLSLSVEHDNPARRLYARVGYRPVGGDGGAVTMVLDLRS